MTSYEPTLTKPHASISTVGPRNKKCQCSVGQRSSNWSMKGGMEIDRDVRIKHAFLKGILLGAHRFLVWAKQTFLKDYG